MPEIKSIEINYGDYDIFEVNTYYHGRLIHSIEEASFMSIDNRYEKRYIIGLGKNREHLFKFHEKDVNITSYK